MLPSLRAGTPGHGAGAQHGPPPPPWISLFRARGRLTSRTILGRGPVLGGSAHSRQSEAENWPRTRPDREPPRGIEPRTYALREPLPVLTLALTRHFGCAVGISRALQAR